jgi:hypothetical protein
MKKIAGGMLLIIAFVLLPMGLFPWSGHDQKFSFDAPDDSWKDMGDVRNQILKDSVVDFSSSKGYFFSVAVYNSHVDDILPWESARKTAETGMSRIRAGALEVWRVRDVSDCYVNNVPGYKIELCYRFSGKVYVGKLIVLVKNNVHYRLLFVALDDVYEASFADYQKILESFKISD